MTAKFRQAASADIPRIAEIYERIIAEEEAGRLTIGWRRGVYPTAATAHDALEAGELYVLEDEGRVMAAAIINGKQAPGYESAAWAQADAPDDRIMVLHTLVVDPRGPRRGYGTRFVGFYEQLAAEQGRPYLRMDTNEKNAVARKLYAKLGYAERGIIPCVFNGIEGVQLVCLEKTLQ